MIVSCVNYSSRTVAEVARQMMQGQRRSLGRGLRFHWPLGQKSRRGRSELPTTKHPFEHQFDKSNISSHPLNMAEDTAAPQAQTAADKLNLIKSNLQVCKKHNA